MSVSEGGRGGIGAVSPGVQGTGRARRRASVRGRQGSLAARPTLGAGGGGSASPLSLSRPSPRSRRPEAPRAARLGPCPLFQVRLPRAVRGATETSRPPVALAPRQSRPLQCPQCSSRSRPLESVTSLAVFPVLESVTSPRVSHVPCSVPSARVGHVPSSRSRPLQCSQCSSRSRPLQCPRARASHVLCSFPRQPLVPPGSARVSSVSASRIRSIRGLSESRIRIIQVASRIRRIRVAYLLYPRGTSDVSESNMRCTDGCAARPCASDQCLRLQALQVSPLGHSAKCAERTAAVPITGTEPPLAAAAVLHPQD